MMKKNAPYILMISGVILFILNVVIPNFDKSKVNYFSTAASVLIIILGFIEFKKKQNNEK